MEVDTGNGCAIGDSGTPCRGPSAEADTGIECGIRDSDTTYDPCIAWVPTPGVGVILTAMWTSGASCAILGFLVGGRSDFVIFGGKNILALPSS